VSIRRACSALQVDRSLYVYKSKRGDQAALKHRIKDICETRVRYGYRRVHVLLQRDGWAANIKRVYRLYRELGLQLRNKTPKRRVKAKLRKIIGYPKSIRVDQGSEFISRDLDLWAYQRAVILDFSRPGKPTDNSFIESFNGKLRAECLNTHWFLSLDDARLKLEDWRRDYNEVRPHSAIGNKAPISLLNGSSAPPPA
jgi:putative transposase